MIKPLYKIIIDDIEQKILKGYFNPGDKLPAEIELMHLYNASKATVRKSLSSLANEGYIYSIPRIGNFVAKPEIHKYIIDFNEIENTSKKIDKIEFADASFIKGVKDETDFLLKIDKCSTENKSILELSRKFLCNSKTIAYDYKCILSNRGNIKDIEYLLYLTFDDIITKELNLYNLDKELIIEVIKCPTLINNILCIGENKPVVKIQQNYCDKSKKMIGYSITYYLCNYVNLAAYSV